MEKPFRWDPEKTAALIQERGISFEQITVAVEHGDLIEIVQHPNTVDYPKQKIMVVGLNGYAYLVPFVDDTEYLFLRTIIPSRKATRDFLGKQEQGHET